MARPRTFDLDETTRAAMNLFWERGYDGVGLADLLDAMGIVRGSFYKAYGSKKEVFLQAIDLYRRDVLDPAVEFLENGGGSGRERVEAVFERGRGAGYESRRGCLLCNTAASGAGVDEDVAARVSRDLGRLKQAFATALGEADDARVQHEAERLTLQYIGLRVSQRAGMTTTK